MKLLGILSPILFIYNFSFSQSISPNPIPDWIQSKWAVLTQNEGIWIADNKKYKNVDEPFDEYGVQWEYGAGENHLKGRLFCIRDGKEIITVWNFTEFWDPRDSIVRVIQIGRNGTVGQGTIVQELNGKEREHQVFTSPDGSSNESGHLSWMEDGLHYTQSFNIREGKWEKSRLYIWRLKKGSD